MNGMSKQLSPGYDFIVSPDKIVAYLPYFGRVFISRSYNGDGGIKFTCEKYNYKLHPFKKNKWTISIQTSGMDENPSFEITVFEDGSAILDFNSNDRQPISFNGKIMASK